jgi:LysR family transcriptional activator for leuABCD operon
VQRKSPRDHSFSSLDLNLLRVFDAIMREGNLTRAGQRLSRTTAAVSHSLARLREITGDPLFLPTGRGMTPTPRAIEMSDHVRNGLDRLSAALHAKPSFDPATAQRTFTIDIPAGGDFVIAPLLMAYVAEHAPGIGFRMSSERAFVLRNELRYGDTEIAMDYEQADREGLHYDLLYKDQFVVMARRGHPAIGREGLTKELFFSLGHVGFSWTRTRGDSPLTQRLARMGMKRRFRLLVPTLGAIPPIVESTDLLTLVSRRVANHCARRWQIDVHEVPFDLEPIPIWFVWHERYNNDPGHAWLRAALKTVCERI